jgi:HTH-type transcriptional regulator / antitoxin HigA
MRVLVKKHLIQFWVVHKSAEQALRAWYDEAISANWQSPQDIKNHYRNASFVRNNRVVFNIKGNDCRLIAAVAYRISVLYMKDLRPIRTEEDYLSALAEASDFVDHEPLPGTKKADRFEMLIMLIEAYEAKHYEIAPPDPIEAIKFHMEQAGLTPKDLQPMIGGLNHVYEILNRKRPLTLK